MWLTTGRNAKRRRLRRAAKRLHGRFCRAIGIMGCAADAAELQVLLESLLSSPKWCAVRIVAARTGSAVFDGSTVDGADRASSDNYPVFTQPAGDQSPQCFKPLE